MEKSKWIWMPHAGHLCISSYCQFHLNTYVGKYIVSTVGEYAPDRKGEFKEIGCGRKYETMVFKAKKSEHKCCPYEARDYSEIDCKGYNYAGEAYKGHLAICEKWSNA